MKWFKFYGQDFLTDSKLGSLNPLQKLMWVALLCIASQDENKTGVIKFLSESRLKELSGISDNPSCDDWERTDETLETFCNMGLVTRPDPDTIIITNFHKKQTQQSTSTERVKEWRDRNRAIKHKSSNGTDETNVTLQSNGRVDKSRIDISNNTSIVENAVEPFKKFWDLYPVKVQKKKAEARWVKLSPVIQGKILKDLPLRARDDGWKRGYIPHPTTYLNGERWEDEINQPKPVVAASKVDRI